MSLVPWCTMVHIEERRPIALASEHGRLEWADQVRAGQLLATLRGGAFARWRMDAWRIGRKCDVIGQVVWLSMCERGRCICSDNREMAHALGRHTGQARTPQPCCVRHGELGRRSSSSFVTRDEIRADAIFAPCRRTRTQPS
eukprot:6211897-Pleurochrysis_carterae.AAC.4